VGVESSVEAATVYQIRVPQMELDTVLHTVLTVVRPVSSKPSELVPADAKLRIFWKESYRRWADQIISSGLVYGKDLSSPNGQFVLHLSEGRRGKNEKMMIMTAASEEIASIPLQCRTEDVDWSPDSRHIAVICVEERFGYLPWELVFLALGHPIPYDTFHLRIYDLNGRLEATRLIARNVRYGSADLVWLRDELR
jgi:hypothetical protein